MSCIESMHSTCLFEKLAISTACLMSLSMKSLAPDFL